MQVNRRQLLVSAAVAVVLFVPAGPAATAANDDGAARSGKQALLQQMKDRNNLRSLRTTTESGGRLSRLAAEVDTGRVVIAVKVRPGADGAAATYATVAGSARAQGGKQRLILRRLDTVTVEVPRATAMAFTAQMRGRKDVAKVQLVQRRSLSFVPDDQNYQATAPYLGAVTAPAAWDVQIGDPDVRIAVVDSGADVNHPDLIGRVADTYNAVTGGTDVTDTVGHGTFVAGVAAATGNNGIGIAGASMGASVLAVKVADANDLVYTDAVAAGVIWAADHSAKVINLSLGSVTSDPVEQAAIAYATGKGVLVVAAAGNDANMTPNYPAAYPQVVAVGATDASGGRAAFSSFGSWVTVAAPGVSLTGTTPTSGSSAFQPGYDVASGTSFSSPIVAAEAALLWSLRPGVPASDIRQAIVTSSHAYANLGLGAGQVDFRAAYDALRPDSIPTMTQPADGAIIAGVVQLSAASAARKVRFLINGAPWGAPIATNAGAATTTWTSWGVANGVLTVAAVDCSIDDLCNAPATQVSVTLANVAPALTAPQPSKILSGSATFTATAPGGGVAFIIDGIRRGFDAVAPYAMTYPISSLRDGAHNVNALSCSTTGTACAGPASPLVSFTAKSLHPRFTAVSPSLFSPNGDRRYDTTKATYYLPDTETARFQIRNAAGTIVRGPHKLGTLSAGTRTLTWNGLLNSGARAGNGTYTIELSTSRATVTGTLLGSAIAHVRVDVAAPAMSSITGNGGTFYPYPDSYKDTFAPTFSLSEAATVTLIVRTGAGTVVRSLVGRRVAGRTSIVWNGKNTAGATVTAGRYYWTLTAQDSAGNRRATSRYGVITSGKRLVAKTATLSLRGAQSYSVGGSDPGCAWASNTASYFSPNGVWLANACDPLYGVQIAAAFYRFTLPAAASYTSLRVETYGFSTFAPSTLGAVFTQWATGGYTHTPEITIGRNIAWRAIGTVPPGGLVNGSRQVDTAIYVPNDYFSASDYDVGQVRLVVAYKVLA